MAWEEIKMAVNSTALTNDMKPLDELINYNECRKKKFYIPISDEYAIYTIYVDSDTTKRRTPQSITFTPKAEGDLLIQVQNDYSGGRRGSINVSVNGGTSQTYSATIPEQSWGEVARLSISSGNTYTIQYNLNPYDTFGLKIIGKIGDDNSYYFGQQSNA